MWFGAGARFVLLAYRIADPLPNDRQTGFAKATKTSGTAKVCWRQLNSKRSLPVLEWTSESEDLKNSPGQ